MSSFEHLNVGGLPGSYIFFDGYDNMEDCKIRKGVYENGKEGAGEINLSGLNRTDQCTNLRQQHFPDTYACKYQQEHQTERIPNSTILDDLYLDATSPQHQSSHEEVKKLDSILSEELVEKYPSLRIINKFASGFTGLKGENIELPSSYEEREIPKGGQKLSMGDILRIAGEIFIRSSSQNVDVLSMLNHHISFPGLSEDNKLDVDLVTYLFASAEKIAQQKYVSAFDILGQCENLSSKTGNPVQRLVYYFCEALREKINRETGKTTLMDFVNQQHFDMDEAMMSPNPTIIALHKQLPFSQISTYTAIQTIIENIVEAKKIHVVDLEIRSGLQYTVLMQALAVRHKYPVQLLKITAIGTKSKEKIEKTGEWLTSFAKSINLPFSFEIVMVLDMSHLRKEDFKIEEDETVAVYSSYLLRTVIAKQDSLESLMRLLKDINPCIFVVIEVEANHSSPLFVKRFIESLFFFGAYFDCLGDCMDSDDPHRTITESIYFGEGIRNIISAESDERTIRNVSISAWRSFFARFGMIEEEISTPSLYQASLLVKNFIYWSSYSFAMDEKCLTVGWKGTPLFSISAWKFTHQE